MNNQLDIANLFWKFHNDRLKNPELTDMTPYVKPIMQAFEEEITKALIAELKKVAETTEDWDVYVFNRVNELSKETSKQSTTWTMPVGELPDLREQPKEVDK